MMYMYHYRNLSLYGSCGSFVVFRIEYNCDLSCNISRASEVRLVVDKRAFYILGTQECGKEKN